MNFQERRIFRRLILLFSLTGPFSRLTYAVPTLEPVGLQEVSFNASFALTCTADGSFPSISWVKDTYSTIALVQPDCTLLQGPISGYNVTCPDQNTQVLSILNVDLGLHLSTFQCEVAYGPGNYPQSQGCQLYVQVPVSAIEMKNITSTSVAVLEGVPTTFSCHTSASRPNASVYWYRRGVDNQEERITSGITNTFVQTGDGLVTTRSILLLSSSRIDQGSSIYCMANNTNSNSVISPEQPDLNVLYAPNGLPVIEGYSNMDNISLIENSTHTIVCVITGGNPKPVLTWNCTGGTQTNGSSGNNVISNITLTGRREQDGPCRCSASHVLWSTPKWVEVIVEILYPPTKPTIEINGESRHGSVKIINNTDVPLNCKSSGKPVPDFSWTYRSMTKTVSSVNFTVNGNDTATCTASNTLTVSGELMSKSSSIEFHILYGPNVPKLFCYSNSGNIPIDASINVIEGNNVTLFCTSDGDPIPEYSWNGTTGNTITTPNVQRDVVYTCTAMNEPKPDYGGSSKMYATNHVGISMLYGPQGEPTLTYRYNSTVSTTKATHVNVSENSTFHLICNNSDSRPPPTYRWTGDTTSSNGNLLVTEIKRSGKHDANGTSFTEFTCVVENEMMSSCGDRSTITRETRHPIKVFVLYPAYIEAPENKSVLEGRDVVLTANVISHGSPRETYSWTFNDSQITDTLTHTLKNVSRHNAGYYTIQATNTIAATGFQPYQEIVKTRTYLNVFYTTTISSFTVDGGRGDIKVNENDTVTLECLVDSNPLSNVYIDASTYEGTETLAKTQSQNTVLHTIQTTTCWDAGSYRCYGYNNYTQNHSYSNISRLRVNCTPRPRFFTGQNVTFYEALGGRIELNLTIIAHPEPNEESYRWWKLYNGDWFDVVNETNINVTTAWLDSRVTITGVQQSDFGQYRLTVDYQGGTYNHLFFIAPKDKPQTPTQFIHRLEFITQSSAVLTWTPGFNGGSAQTFYILYKKQSDSDWKEIIVTPEGTNVTITGLSPGTIYLVKMYAHNSQGNSTETTTITVTTQEAEPENPDQLPILAGAAGGGGVAVIVVCVVIVVFVIRKRKQPGSKSEQRQSLYKEQTIYDENGMQLNKAYESVESMGIQQQTTSGDVYAKVDKTKKENINADNTYAVVDKSKKSEHKVQGQGSGDVYATPMKKKHGKGGKKTKATKKKGNDVYENAHELNMYNGDGSNGASPDENIYENRQESQTAKRNLNKDGLLYADLAFNNNNKGRRKLVIHGLENATEYVQVDFTKKADPLPDSDDDGENA